MIDEDTGSPLDTGGAPKGEDDDRAAGSDIPGTAARNDEKPSSGSGETTSAEPGGPIDMDTAHDRAS